MTRKVHVLRREERFYLRRDLTEKWLLKDVNIFMKFICNSHLYATDAQSRNHVDRPQASNSGDLKFKTRPETFVVVFL
jgi:hypothetical protein